MAKHFYIIVVLVLAICLQVGPVQAEEEEGPVKQVQRRILDFMGIEEFKFKRQYYAERRQKFWDSLRTTTSLPIKPTETTTRMTNEEMRRKLMKMMGFYISG